MKYNKRVVFYFSITRGVNTDHKNENEAIQNSTVPDRKKKVQYNLIPSVF